jgi:hypothetical protein
MVYRNTEVPFVLIAIKCKKNIEKRIVTHKMSLLLSFFTDNDLFSRLTPGAFQN